MGRGQLGGGMGSVVAPAELWLRTSGSLFLSQKLLASHLRGISSNSEKWFLCMRFLIWGAVIRSGGQ